MVEVVGRSGIFLNAVSNRLAAASTDARFLGMIIGTAISQLIEPPGKAMIFDLEEMESDEARWYLDLVDTNDDLGSLELIKKGPAPTRTQKPAKSSATSTAHAKRQANMPQGKIVAIEEVEDSEEEGKNDGQRKPYEDSDSESDSDGDPTLVRKKPTPPV